MAKKKKARVRRALRANSRAEKIREHFRELAKERGHDYVGQLDAKTILPMTKKFGAAASAIYKYRTQVAQEGDGKGGNDCHKAAPAVKGFPVFETIAADVLVVKELGIERTRAVLNLIDLVTE